MRERMYVVVCMCVKVVIKKKSWIWEGIGGMQELKEKGYRIVVNSNVWSSKQNSEERERNSCNSSFKNKQKQTLSDV